MIGVICVDKPFGCTSFDVIFKLRRILNVKKVGHGGTLDPIATGVLPVFFGRATKAIQFLPNTDKTYIAGFKLGEITDTFDCTGRLLLKNKSEVNFEQLKAALNEFKGTIQQVPPKFSAVKVNGVAAYRLARQGRKFEIKAKTVNVFEIYCTEFDEVNQLGKLYISCSGGTYVRSICNELGLKLGVGCVMTSLVRLKACGFSLNTCHSLSEVELFNLKGKLSEVVIDLAYIFRNFKKVHLNSNERFRFLNGAPVVLQDGALFELGELVAVFFQNKILGVAKFKNNMLIVEKIFI